MTIAEIKFDYGYDVKISRRAVTVPQKNPTSSRLMGLSAKLFRSRYGNRTRLCPVKGGCPNR